MPSMNHKSLNNGLPITVTCESLIDENINTYLIQYHVPLTNLSLSFPTQNPEKNGYGTYNGINLCNFGYSGNDCSLPLHYIILISIFIILITTKLQLPFTKKLKYYGYIPIDNGWIYYHYSQ